MEEDRELQAISQVNTALKDLSEEERYRVMQWAVNKYLQNAVPLKFAGPAATAVATPAAVLDAGVVATGEDTDKEHDEAPAYDTFAEMLDASGAETENDRFLVAAYWVQVKSAQQTWKSFQTNKLLKDTGYQIKISNCLRSLLGAKPALVVQVSKNAAGTKLLKLTTEGIKKVQVMLGENQA